MNMLEIYYIVCGDLRRADLERTYDNILEGMVEFISLQDEGEIEDYDYDNNEDIYEQVEDWLREGSYA